MFNIKHYKSIDRHGKRGTHLTVEGSPYITLTEKLDGSNSSFKREDDQVAAFSRNTRLDEENNLRGFYQWTQEAIDSSLLNENYIYFGEYLARHKLDYGENQNKFYLFDVYDISKEEYLDFNAVKEEALRIGVNLVPVFYEGEFQSIEHIKSFVGKSMLGEQGEGVVCKVYDYRDRFGNQVFTKFVSDEFAEMHKTKKHKVSDKTDPLTEFIKSTLTEARVSKMIHKLVDTGDLPEDYAIEDMGTILRHLGSSVYDDIMEEESEILMKVVKRQVGRAIPNVVKQVLTNEGRV